MVTREFLYHHMWLRPTYTYFFFRSCALPMSVVFRRPEVAAMVTKKKHLFITIHGHRPRKRFFHILYPAYLRYVFRRRGVAIARGNFFSSPYMVTAHSKRFLSYTLPDVCNVFRRRGVRRHGYEKICISRHVVTAHVESFSYTLHIPIMYFRCGGCHGD